MTAVTPLLAWHSDPQLKAEVADRMRKHREADEIVQGLYQLISPELASGYKGCLIGCTLPAQPVPSHRSVASYRVQGVEPVAPEPGWHGRVEELYGIPTPVGYLLDRAFEGLPAGDGAHAAFAVTSIEAIPVGADLTGVASRLMLDLLADPAYGVRQYTPEGSAQRAAVDMVIGLYERRLEGDEPSADEWRLAHAAAAADAAAYAAAAADAAAYAAAAAAAAADAAADAAAAADAGWWQWAAQRLLQHLANAPIPAHA